MGGSGTNGDSGGAMLDAIQQMMQTSQRETQQFVGGKIDELRGEMGQMKEAFGTRLQAVEGTVATLGTDVASLREQHQDHDARVQELELELKQCHDFIARANGRQQRMWDSVIGRYAWDTRFNVVVHRGRDCALRFEGPDKVDLATVLGCRGGQVQAVSLGSNTVLLRCSSQQLRNDLLLAQRRRMMQDTHKLVMQEDLHELEREDKQFLIPTMDRKYKDWVGGGRKGIHWRRAVVTWFEHDVACSLSAAEVRDPVSQCLMTDEQIDGVINRKCEQARAAAAQATSTAGHGHQRDARAATAEAGAAGRQGATGTVGGPHHAASQQYPPPVQPGQAGRQGTTATGMGPDVGGACPQAAQQQQTQPPLQPTSAERRSHKAGDTHAPQTARRDRQQQGPAGDARQQGIGVGDCAQQKISRDPRLRTGGASQHTAGHSGHAARQQGGQASPFAGASILKRTSEESSHRSPESGREAPGLRHGRTHSVPPVPPTPHAAENV